MYLREITSFLVPFTYLANLHTYISAVYAGTLFQYHFYVSFVLLSLVLAFSPTNSFTKLKNYLFRYAVWALLFILLCIFSIIFIESSGHAQSQAMGYVWPLVCSVAFGLLVHSTDRLIKYALIGTLSAVVTLWGVTIFELLNPDVRLFSSASNYIEDQQVVGVATRIGGLFVNPNANGLALVLGMFATYFFVPRGLRFLYTILVGIAVLATVSRGSIVVWVASCAVLYTMDCLRNKAKLRYISAIGFMVLLITLFLSGKTPDFLENVGMGEFLNENMKMRLAGNFFSQEDSSAETRDELATAALSQFVDSPVLGAGLGASQPIGTLGTHNLIAKIGVELGIVGVITFYFGLYFLTIFYRNYYGFWFLSVFTLASLFTHSVFEHAYFSILLVILIVLIPQNELRATGKRKRRRRKKRARRSYNIATSSEG